MRCGGGACGAAVSREPPEEPSLGARHAGAHQPRGPAAPPPSGRCSGSLWGLVLGRLTIGCSGCGAGHTFERTKGLRAGPAPTDPWGVRRAVWADQRVAIVWARIQAATCSSVWRPSTTAITTSYASASEAVRRAPFRSRKVAAAAKPTRLLPSM
jgi:hypothetical protein